MSVESILKAPDSLEEMDREERSLLLYLETRAVDHAGAVATPHMNRDDMVQAKLWSISGFIEFGPIAPRDHRRLKAKWWVRLSARAWELAHQERKARAQRTWKSKSWEKATKEEAMNDDIDWDD